MDDNATPLDARTLGERHHKAVNADSEVFDRDYANGRYFAPTHKMIRRFSEVLANTANFVEHGETTSDALQRAIGEAEPDTEHLLLWQGLSLSASFKLGQAYTDGFRAKP